MPRPCSVCNSPDREAIEKAMLSGESFRNLKERFGKSTTALFRHRQSHLPASLVRARKAKEVARADRLIDRVLHLCERSEGLVDAAEEIMAEARQSKDTRTALDAIRAAATAARELRNHFSLLGELSGELRKGGPTVHVDQGVVLLPSIGGDGATHLLGLTRPTLDAPVVETKE